MKKTLISLFQSAVNRSGDMFFLYKKIYNDEWKGYTFKQIQEKAIALSVYFRNELKLVNSEKIAILAESSPEWVIAELGILHNSNISVPLSLKLLVDELQFRLEHSESQIIVCSKITISKIMELTQDILSKLKIFYLDEDRTIVKKLVETKELKEENVFFLDDALKIGLNLVANENIFKKQQDIWLGIEENDLATISYSSGTTGNPKGVMLSHKNYFTNTQFPADYHYFPSPEELKILIILPIDHAFGHTVGIYFGINSSAQLYFLDTRGGSNGMIRAIPENIKEIKPYLLMVVPALAQNFMKKIMQAVKEQGKIKYFIFQWALNASIRYNGNIYHKPSILKRILTLLPRFIGNKLIFPKIRKALPIKMLLGGGAVFDRKLQEFFWGIGIPFYLGYGMTEASPVIAVTGSKPRCMKMGSVGQFFKELEGKVIKPDGSSCKPKEIGEIIIKGPTVMQGYFKNPEATDQTIRNGWLYTGDRGYLDKDGFLFITGREKAMLINKEGEKYSPEEIEEAIQSTSKYISQALLYCDHNPYTSALLVINEETLKERLRELREKSLLKTIISIDIGDEIKERFNNMKHSQIKKAFDFSNIAKQEEINVHALLKEISEDALKFRFDSSHKDAFPKLWIPNTFILTDQTFEVNSTLKVVRFKVIEQYKDKLNFMYTKEGSNCMNEKNITTLTQVVNKLTKELDLERKK